MQKAVGFEPFHCVNHRVQIDIRSEEIREQEKLDRMYRLMNIIGQVTVALVVSLGVLMVGFQIGRWKGWW